MHSSPPPLKNHPSNPIGFVYSPSLWKITHQNPSVYILPPPLKNHCSWWAFISGNTVLLFCISIEFLPPIFCVQYRKLESVFSLCQFYSSMFSNVENVDVLNLKINQKRNEGATSTFFLVFSHIFQIQNMELRLNTFKNYLKLKSIDLKSKSMWFWRKSCWLGGFYTIFLRMANFRI